MMDKVPILVAIFLGLLLFVAKMRFISKVVQAKTDFSVFNFSLALRLLASGTELGKGLDMNLKSSTNIVGQCILRKKTLFSHNV